MSGERLARASLRLDAVYCMCLGALIAIAAPFVTSSVGLPVPLLVGLGAATFIWGGWVWRGASRPGIRTPTMAVMVANVAASLALAGTGMAAGTTVLMLAALVLAVDVAAFAASQGLALSRLRRSIATDG